MDRPLKKTETIEIRLPHETKLAFMARCKADGVSASEALRGFIGSRLEAEAAASSRAPSRDPAFTAPAGWRKRLQLGAGLAVALGAAATALPSLAASVDRIGFAQLDADGSGGVSLPELSRGARVEVRLAVGATEIGRAPVAPSPAETQERALLDALLRRTFASMDADADGSVSFREFRRR